MHWKDQRIPHSRYDVIRKRFPRYLPHWELEQGTFFLTWRLYDSIPAAAREQLRLESLEMRQRLLESDLDPVEKELILRRFEERYDQWLDRGYGACWLEVPEVADLIEENLRFHDRKLYRIVAWVVMPNHVHAILRFLGNATLGRVMHSLKSYTSKEANRILGRTGTFWQADYFDRIVRSDEDLVRRVEYVAQNPAKAGLEGWRYVGVESGEVENCRVMLKG